LLLGQPQSHAHFANLGADNIRWIFLSGHGQESTLTLARMPALFVMPA
jgi:hypothetical protein